MKRGFFLTLEGLDGAGKTTQIQQLVQKANEWGIETVTTREPGGTASGDAIRSILLDPRYKEIIPLTEAYLFAASRAQHVHEVITPALRQGKLVICDRFLDSSLAFQVAGGGLDYEFVWDLNMRAIQGCIPDRTFILDLQPEDGQARRGQTPADRMEQKPLDYHQCVREGFLQLASMYPERIVVLNACQSAQDIFKQIWEHLAPHLDILR